MTPPIPEQYLNITQFDDINSNDKDVSSPNLLNKQLSPTTAGSSNTKNSHNNNNNSSKITPPKTTPLVKLHEAIDSKLFMVLW